jgi:hypothetical protein
MRPSCQVACRADDETRIASGRSERCSRNMGHAKEALDSDVDLGALMRRMRAPFSNQMLPRNSSVSIYAPTCAEPHGFRGGYIYMYCMQGRRD